MFAYIVRFSHKAFTLMSKWTDRKLLITGLAGTVIATPSCFASMSMCLSPGRVPKMDRLNLEAACAECTRRGIQVNTSMRTSDPAVFAAGECGDSGLNLIPATPPTSGRWCDFEYLIEAASPCLVTSQGRNNESNRKDRRLLLRQ
ncbi:MAG: hypothetical protein CME99_06560 [Hyphomonas sp.]|jgi:pyridine nucleotide-disulfide oxidoreductase|uniref:FAD/NAD(P)-binding domain-containing protein n=2 Tax=Pseudomonadota TaxID=1224 RepID=A0A356W4B4_9PROT|nr:MULTISPECIES: FAD-dependent oxidoreductase [Henriciella]MAB10014.1 hypothetical protein [Hyphomonas sp.]OUX87331.1 MAG: hypothetical protein CBB91_06285 [Hyphomonas sp. TMED31]HBH43052.1 hypothetical protein [Hyphomonas atlantica]HIG22021.1 hypothetical protein [Henriciella sp.]MAH92820.1 hypothetical protein [Hyphomonas sp.]